MGWNHQLDNQPHIHLMVGGIYWVYPLFLGLPRLVLGTNLPIVRSFFRPLTMGLSVEPLPNGRTSWLINRGDPNHLRYKKVSTKVRQIYNRQTDRSFEKTSTWFFLPKLVQVELKEAQLQGRVDVDSLWEQKTGRWIHQLKRFRMENLQFFLMGDFRKFRFILDTLKKRSTST